jgi:hypothetical protein
MKNKTSRPKISGLACLILLMGMGLMGCNAKYFTVQQSPSKPFNSFSEIEVKEFQIDMNNFKELSAEEQADARKFTSALSPRLQARFIERGFFVSKIGEKLILEGGMVEFHPGSKTARCLLGVYGVGKGKIIVEVQFTSQDGTIIARGIAGGGVATGAFGGNMTEAVERLVDAIADFVEKNYQK